MAADKLPPPHPQVPHPADLLATEAVTAWQKLIKGNEWLAFKVAAIYGAALTIWLMLGYTLLGAAEPHMLTTLLYWSNGVQLCFCGVMTFVGNKLSKQSAAKADADHQAQSHVATVVDDIKELLASKETRQVIETAVSDVIREV